ncbi:MAG: 30S ribosomal protein S3 [Thermoplasmata archaeon]|nr:MAG: 30S ribosomal protein S3 [Thermoplasmata archaeon]MCD6573173.1 30S ribosomal protein S3 [Thermoplasmata archaeon]
MAIERKFVQENQKRVLLKEFLMKESERAGFGGIKIQRTPLGTLITLEVERPGLIIGRGGKRIKELTETIANRFNIENPQIEIEEVSDNAALNAQLMAQKVAAALERGWHFRRVGHSTVRRIMDAGARGCQVIISGKLTGDRHRTEKFTMGYIKYCGEVASRVMEEGMATAKTKPGIIGVKVRLMPPHARLPDEIEILKEEEEKETKEEKRTRAEIEKEEMLEKLEGIPIDELKVNKLILEELKKAGIKNARQIYEMDTNDLIEIKGIGIKRAEKLKEMVKEVLKKYESKGDKSDEQ